MIRVLVSAEAEAFLTHATVPGDIAVDLLDPAHPIPAGAPHAGILPLLTRRIGAPEMDRLRGLVVIANMAVGYDNIDLDAARARGIRVTNTPDVLTGATAELTWALILATARRVGEGERLVRARTWTGWSPTQLLGTGLNGKTLGLLGAGRIGRDVGRRAGAFGMRVAYWGRSRHPAFEAACGARWCDDPAALARESDVLSIHLASTDATRGLVDGALLDRLRPGAIVVNTARGDVVDEPALVERLRTGRLRAGLDVYAREPAVPEGLVGLENVVLLPHLGSATEEARQAMFDLAWDNLVRVVKGEEPVTPVV
ncbi:MAG TPA: D-glycerate dehydrogenase [Longimicrobiales bacterium]|nr:D-glycerate dehydrogenase [Longimicrobiales bacterium]